MKKYIFTLLLVVYGTLLLFFSDIVSINIVRTVNICINVIIPSLFGFMVLSGIFISSGAYKILSLPFDFVARYIFKIPTELFSIFIISSVAGYPVGAKLLSKLYENNAITKETADEMMGYCYLGGPAFFCGVIGNKVYRNTKIGIIIFVSILFSNIVIAVFKGFFKPVPPKQDKCEYKINFSFKELVDSIIKGGFELIKICGVIIFFSTIISILDGLGVINFISYILSISSGIGKFDCNVIVKSILDVTNITNITPIIHYLPLITSILSFGGICILTQVESLSSNKLLTYNFYFSRIISLTVSYLCCKIIIINMNIAVQAINNFMLFNPEFTPIPSLFLLIMTGFIMTAGKIVKKKVIL